MPGREASLEPIAQLIDELRHNNSAVRLNAFQNIHKIAEALGPERTRVELIPYLTEFVDGEDDILSVLAEKLGEVVSLVGGDEYVHLVLVPLESLVLVEEPTVRNKTLAVVNDVVTRMPSANVFEYMVPLLKRLAASFWFTSRISATSLFRSTYVALGTDEKSTSTKDELRELFCRLCEDETPMVRRAACQSIGKLAEVLPFGQVQAHLYPLTEKLAADEQDSVRLLVVDSCIDLGKVFQTNDPAACANKMLPLILRLCRDKSWRVRHIAAQRFVELMEAVKVTSDSKEVGELVNGYAVLLRDVEPEVRTAAALRVGDVANLLGAQVTSTKLIGPIQALVKDSSQFTRAALGSVIMSIAQVLPKQEVIDTLLPLYLALLKDSHADVRLNIISKLSYLHNVIGIDSISPSLLPAIIDLAMDKQWRVRLAIIEQVPDLARQFGHEYFEKKLSDLCMNWLGDQVFSIRQAATKNLTRLSEVFGAEWSTSHIVPKVVNLGTHKSYLFRMTALFAAKDLASVLGPELTAKLLIPLVLKLAKDVVPNVRFNAAKALGELRNSVPQEVVKSDIVPALQALTHDKNNDPDVMYFAQKALEAVNNPSEEGEMKSNGH